MFGHGGCRPFLCLPCQVRYCKNNYVLYLYDSYLLQARKSPFLKTRVMMLRLIQNLTLPEDISSQLPSRMIAIRKANGLTQAVVADRLGITHGGYGHYERGFRRVPLGMVPKLAKALECSEAELLGLNEDKKSKRGPISGWEKRVAAIKSLSRERQKEIQNVVDALLDKAS